MRATLLGLWLVLTPSLGAWAQPTAVFWEEGFPAVDTAPPDRAALEALPNSRLAGEKELPSLLADPGTKLLVLPFGSTFPESAWPALYAYLQRGGNLLSLGGRPFSVPVYRSIRWGRVYGGKAFFPENRRGLG